MRLFDPFWESVRGLGIPVFWEIVGIPDPNSQDDLLREVQRLNRWADRWPDIRGVWTHGFAPDLLERMPPPLAELLGREQLMVEILYPIHWARDARVPVPRAAPSAGDALPARRRRATGVGLGHAQRRAQLHVSPVTPLRTPRRRGLAPKCGHGPYPRGKRRRAICQLELSVLRGHPPVERSRWLRPTSAVGRICLQ